MAALLGPCTANVVWEGVWLTQEIGNLATSPEWGVGSTEYGVTGVHIAVQGTWWRPADKPGGQVLSTSVLPDAKHPGACVDQLPFFGTAHDGWAVLQISHRGRLSKAVLHEV